MIWENSLHTSETDCFVQESGVLCQTRYAFVYLQHPPYTAFGKTVTAIGLIAERKINTLILVHTKALLDQWKSRLEEFLEIDFTEEDLPKKRGSALYLTLIFSVVFIIIIIHSCYTHLQAVCFYVVLHKRPAKEMKVKLEVQFFCVYLTFGTRAASLLPQVPVLVFFNF